MGQDTIVGSEDCLYLNVWRPQSQERDLSVYFWIHGGGNTIQQPPHNIAHGANVASQSNMVFVSINYRLGEFGGFCHPALRNSRPGDEYDDSGNYGVLDMIKALGWVYNHIRPHQALDGRTPAEYLIQYHPELAPKASLSHMW